MILLNYKEKMEKHTLSHTYTLKIVQVSNFFQIWVLNKNQLWFVSLSHAIWYWLFLKEAGAGAFLRDSSTIDEGVTLETSSLVQTPIDNLG